MSGEESLEELQKFSALPQSSLMMFGPASRVPESITVLPARPSEYHQFLNMFGRFETPLISLPAPKLRTMNDKEVWFTEVCKIQERVGKPHHDVMVYNGDLDLMYMVVPVCNRAVSSDGIVDGVLQTTLSQEYTSLVNSLYNVEQITKSEACRKHVLYHLKKSDVVPRTHDVMILAKSLQRNFQHSKITGQEVRDKLPRVIDTATLLLRELEGIVGPVVFVPELRNSVMKNWKHRTDSNDLAITPAFTSNHTCPFLCFTDIPRFVVDTSVLTNKSQSCIFSTIAEYKGGVGEYIIQKRLSINDTFRAMGVFFALYTQSTGGVISSKVIADQTHKKHWKETSWSSIARKFFPRMQQYDHKKVLDSAMNFAKEYIKTKTLLTPTGKPVDLMDKEITEEGLAQSAFYPKFHVDLWRNMQTKKIEPVHLSVSIADSVVTLDEEENVYTTTPSLNGRAGMQTLEINADVVEQYRDHTSARGAEFNFDVGPYLLLVDSILGKDNDVSLLSRVLSNEATGFPAYWEGRNRAILQYTQATVRSLAQGGSIVLTLPELVSPFSISLLFLLYRVFCEVHVVTTKASHCVYTSQRVIYCRGLREYRPKWIEQCLTELDNDLDRVNTSVTNTALVKQSIIHKDDDFMTLQRKIAVYRVELQTCWVSNMARDRYVYENEFQLQQQLVQIIAETKESQRQVEDDLLLELGPSLDNGEITEDALFEQIEHTVCDLKRDEAEIVLSTQMGMRADLGLASMPAALSERAREQVTKKYINATMFWRSD